MLLPRIRMRLGQIVWLDPDLPAGRDVLAFILTDTTMVQGVAAIVIRRPAGCAQLNHHFSLRNHSGSRNEYGRQEIYGRRWASQGFRALKEKFIRNKRQGFPTATQRFCCFYPARECHRFQYRRTSRADATCYPTDPRQPTGGF